MFTGIVCERARTVSFGNRRLVVESSLQPGVGDSIAVDGVCLTVVEAENGHLSFDVLEETMARSKRFGDAVNLEPALAAGDPLGGHYVQGHVDGVGTVVAVEMEGDGARIAIDAPADLLRYCVEKGSIAVEGVSLTIAELHDDAIGLTLIPHTIAETTLARLVPGQRVNLEVDVLAKYVEKLLAR